MSEIDLIPIDYKDYVSKLACLKYSVVVASVFLICSSISYKYLDSKNSNIQTNIIYLKKSKEIQNAKKTKLAALRRKYKDLKNNLYVLDVLENLDTNNILFTIIEKALPAKGLWFEKIQVKTLDANIKESTTKQNHLVKLLSLDKPSELGDLQISTKIHIKGKAENHSYLTQLVNGLQKEAEVKEAHIVHASLKPYKGIDLVDYEINIITSKTKV